MLYHFYYETPQKVLNFMCTHCVHVCRFLHRDANLPGSHLMHGIDLTFTSFAMTLTQSTDNFTHFYHICTSKTSLTVTDVEYDNLALQLVSLFKGVVTSWDQAWSCLFWCEVKWLLLNLHVRSPMNQQFNRALGNKLFEIVFLWVKYAHLRLNFYMCDTTQLHVCSRKSYALDVRKGRVRSNTLLKSCSLLYVQYVEKAIHASCW